jgi:Fe-S-cluster containining protein
MLTIYARIPEDWRYGRCCLDPKENYKMLLAKTDEKSREIVARYPEHIRCSKGCHTCCIQGLTVNGLERSAIRDYLTSRPALRQEAEKNAAANPHQGQRCAFLNAAGACLIYEARPVVCRSHGVPLKIERDVRDVCPLNFADMKIDDIGEHYFINLETLNTILVLLNRQFDAARADSRYLLTPAGILSDD